MSKQKLILPESWNEVTIKQYVDITKIDTTNNIEALINILHILTGVSKDVLNNIDPSELTVIEQTLHWMTTAPSTEIINTEYTLNGNTYSYSRKFDKLTVGEMVSYEMLVESNKLSSIESFPYILAIILREKSEQGDLEVFNSDIIYDRVALFEKELSIGETMGLIFFFQNGGKDYITVLEDSLTELRQTLQEMKKELKKNNPLDKNGSGLE